MKVLIIEDDKNKIRQISSFLAARFESVELIEKHSYQSGLREALLSRPDLIILDMSLPTFDQRGGESGYKFRAYGGKEILSEMKRKGVLIKTVVVTQFESFGEGANYTTLTELKSELQRRFPENYSGTIFYSASESNWQNMLEEVVREFLNKRDSNHD